MASNVRARIRVLPSGYTVEAQRAKYKHWFPLGIHRATDAAFRKALADGHVMWQTKIIEDILF